MRSSQALRVITLCCWWWCGWAPTAFGAVFDVDLVISRYYGRTSDANRFVGARVAQLVGDWQFYDGGSVEGDLVVHTLSLQPANTTGAESAPHVVVRLVPYSAWVSVVQQATGQEAVEQNPQAEGEPFDIESTSLQQLRDRVILGSWALPSTKYLQLNTTRDLPKTSSADSGGGPTEQPPASSAVTSSWRWTVQGGRYAVVVQQATNTTVRVTGQVTLLNPGGVQSSAELTPLLNLFVTFAIVHVLLLVGYAVVLHRRRKEEHRARAKDGMGESRRSRAKHHRSPKLPRVLYGLLAVMLTECLGALLNAVRYQLLRGDQDQDESALGSVVELVAFLSDVLLITTLVLLVTGATIVYRELPARSKQFCVVVVVVFILLRLASFICSVAKLTDGTSCAAYGVSDSLARFVGGSVCGLALLRLIDAVGRRLSAPWATDLVAMRRGYGDGESPSRDVEAGPMLARTANLGTLLILQSFRWPLLLWLSLHLLGLVFSSTTLSRADRLVSSVIHEFSALAFIAATAYLFSSVRSTPPRPPTSTAGRRGSTFSGASDAFPLPTSGQKDGAGAAVGRGGLRGSPAAPLNNPAGFQQRRSSSSVIGNTPTLARAGSHHFGAQPSTTSTVPHLHRTRRQMTTAPNSPALGLGYTGPPLGRS